MKVKVETVLKHPVYVASLQEFLDYLPRGAVVEMRTFEGDITVTWEEQR